MADFALNGFSSVQRTLANNESGFITQNGALVTLNQDAVVGTGSNELSVLGTLAAQGNGSTFNAYQFTGSTMTFTVGALGNVSSRGDAVQARSTATMNVNNVGVIQTGEDALDLRTTDGSSVIEVINNGIIQADSDGIVTESGSQIATIINTGQILSHDTGIFNSFTGTTTGDFLLVNSGTISGQEYGYEGNDTDQSIYNTGLISGINSNAIEFEGGTNLYDGRGGQVIGTIQGGTGVDTFIGGDLADVMDGGDGADRLYGGAGSDEISGGAGDDILRGNEGADVFNFEVGNQTDRIRDWEDGVDLLDFSDFGLTGNQVLANAHQVGDNVRFFGFGGGDLLIVEDATIADITLDDLIVM